MKANQIEISGVVFNRTFGDFGFSGYLFRKLIDGEMRDCIVPKPIMPLKSRQDPIGGIPPVEYEREYLEDFLAVKLD